MDGFDDLLTPSRRGFEENPFANPFSNDRPHSPDPWSSPFADTQQDEGFGSEAPLDPYANPYESLTSSSPTKHDTHKHDGNDHATIPAPATSSSPTITKVEESPLSDPLDSAAHANEEDEEPPVPRRKRPGFRESLDTSQSSFDETATIRPTEPELFDGLTIPSSKTAQPLPPPAKAVVTPQPIQEERTERDADEHREEGSSKGFVSHTLAASTSAKTPEFASPVLDGGLGGGGSSGIGIGSSLGGSTLNHDDEFVSGGVSGGWGGDNTWGASSEPLPSTSTGSTPTEISSTAAGKQRADDDDSDDDRPISQTLSKIQNEDSDRVKALGSRKAGIQPVFAITVDDPQKIGDPLRSFTMYTVHTKTTSPMYPKSSFSVLRRYSDFLWLYETLQFNNPGVVVPPVPEKNTFGRFDDTFVRQRRLGLEKCIQKIANHPVLGKDQDLKFFLESDTFALDMKHRKAESAHEKGGLIASIGQTLAGPRFYETDEWFDKQKAYLDSLESQLKGLVKAIEMVAKQRAELATVTGEFAQTIGDIASSDVGAQLSQSLSGLANVERKAQELQTIQSDQDLITILSTSEEYSRLISSVRLAFSSRIRIYHQWKNSESDLLRIKKNHEKNRAQGQIPTDKLSYSLQQIAEAERRAGESKLEYEQVSKLVKQEVARFEQERIEDFKDALHAFLEGMIARQKELIVAWENYQGVLLKRSDNEPGQTSGPQGSDAE